eukprot:SAG31_NODE_177_length_21310_cov_8.894064_17_plen_213_part_00
MRLNSRRTRADREAFAVLVRGGPGAAEGESPGPCQQVFGGLVFQGLTQIAGDQRCGAFYDACVGRNDNWCRNNLRDGVGASLAPASRAKFEATLCKDASPEYRALYECVSSAGFSGEEAWTDEKCLAAAEASGVSWLWLPLVLVLGVLLGFCCSKKMTGRASTQYKNVNESEVRSLIAEYVDSSGISPRKSSKGKDVEKDSMYEDDEEEESR